MIPADYFRFFALFQSLDFGRFSDSDSDPYRTLGHAKHTVREDRPAGYVSAFYKASNAQAAGHFVHQCPL